MIITTIEISMEGPQTAKIRTTKWVDTPKNVIHPTIEIPKYHGYCHTVHNSHIMEPVPQ